MGWILATATLLGLLVLAIGLRGRRVSDRPTCRTCGFDLRGRAEATDTCPECAADLSFPRAIRQGRRVRRRGLVAMGGLLTVATLGLDGLYVWASVTRRDLTHLKPDWWLVAEARAGGAGADRALGELVVRLGSGELSAASAALLVDRALDEQADPDGTWFTRWSAVFEAARQAGLVGEGQLETFARQVLPFELRHRERVRRGAPWTLAQAVSSVRMTRGMPLSRWTLLERLEVGDQVVFERVVTPEMIPAPTDLGGPRGRTDWVMREHPMPPLDLPEGRHPVRGVVFVQVFDPRTSPPTKILEERIEVGSEITVVSPETETVRLVDDADLAGAVRAAIEPRSARIFVDRDLVYTWSAIDVDGAPVGLAFDVTLRAGERSWPVGSFAVAAGTRVIVSYGDREFPLEGLDLEGLTTIDLVLEPSATAAEGLTAGGGERFWGAPLVIRGVPVEVVKRR